MKIEQLDLLAPAPEALAAFYGQQWGLPLLAQGPDECVVQAGYTRLAFARAPNGWAGAYHFAFNIPENQFAEAKAWLAQRAPLVGNAKGADEFPFAKWDARAVYAYDPAGNIIELIARHSLPSAATRPFGSESLLGVSEIGLPSADVIGLARRLQAAGLEVFRDTLSEGFGAVGAETGLFILVSEGRPWNPDQRLPAAAWPLTATLLTGGGQRLRLSGPPYTLRPV